jgi:hypothetical protein
MMNKVSEDNDITVDVYQNNLDFIKFSKIC